MSKPSYPFSKENIVQGTFIAYTRIKIMFHIFLVIITMLVMAIIFLFYHYKQAQ